MEKDQRFYELITSVGLALLSCFLLHSAFTAKSTSSPGMMAAMDFPKAILFSILSLSLYLIIRNLLIWRSEAAKSEKGVGTDKRVWFTVGLIIAYALAWNCISFSLATLAYIAVQAKILDRGLKWLNCFLISLLSTAAVLAAFRVIFKVALSEELLVTLGVLY